MFMFPLSYTNTEVVVEKKQMPNIVSSLGDAGIQRSVLIESDSNYIEWDTTLYDFISFRNRFLLQKLDILKCKNALLLTWKMPQFFMILDARI